MKSVMVRYKTREDAAEANATLVRAVYDELGALAPVGFRYATYRLPDGVTFVHVATTDEGATTPLSGLASFKAFQSELKSRCVELPVVTDVTRVGSYG